MLILGLAVMVTLIAGQFDLSVGGMATLTTFLSIGLKINQDWPFAARARRVPGRSASPAGCSTASWSCGCGSTPSSPRSAPAACSPASPPCTARATQLSPTVDSKGELPGWFSGPDSFGAFGHKFPALILWIGLGARRGLGLHGAAPPSPRLRARSASGTAICAAIVAVAVAVALLLVGVDNWVAAASWTIGLLLVIALVIWVLLGHTTYGRYLHATGSNREAARLAGVNPGKETIKAFVLGGLLAARRGHRARRQPGLGVARTSRSGSCCRRSPRRSCRRSCSPPAASPSGARSIGGTFLVWVSQGLIVGGLPFTWTDVVNGVVLIIAVALSTVFFRRQTT